MKIVKEFILREIAGECVLVPTGATSQEFNGMITISDTAKFIWENIEKVTGMPYLIMEPFLHVDTLLATSSVAFLLHREVSVHYQILVFSIAARNASIEILLLVSVPDSDRKS